MAATTSARASEAFSASGLTTLEHVASRINNATTNDEILDAMWSELRSPVPYDRIALLLIEEDRNTLR